jgi:geranylgeranyl diphosphate synthase type I
MGPWTPSHDELRRAVDEHLHAFLDDRRAALGDAAPLIDEITRLIDSGGKRIRPAFCYWGFRATGREHTPAAVQAAASLELLHTFAIVHDDIMDRSEERRGVPTVHVMRGLDVALLAGDLALVLADALFVGSGFAPVDVARAFEHYSRMRQQVIAGQFLDLELSGDPDVTEERARWVAVLKSGRYTVEQPLAIGASLGGGDPDLLAGLARFGAPLGEAFQLRDDLLGTFGRRASVGKPTDSDIREGKRHVPYAKAAAALTGEERDFLVTRWGGGASLTPEQVERLRDLLETSGARRATEELLEELTRDASAVLATLAIPDAARAALTDLVHLATARDA